VKEIHAKILFFELALGGFLRFLNLLHFHALDSDEALYAQAALAMTKGYIPYKDIFFAHPPVYLHMEYLVIRVSPSLLSMRIFNVLLGLAITCLIFYTVTLVYSERSALIASGVYVLFPLAIHSNKTALVDNGLTFFTTLMMLFFIKYLRGKKTKHLALSGAFAGIALMTKYTAVLVIGALVLFSLFTFFRKRIAHLLIFILSAVIFPLAIFFLLLLTDVWPYFFVQTIQWNIIRFGMPANEKFWFFAQLVFSLSPIILPAMLATPRNIGDRTWQLMMVWFLVPLGVLPFSKVVFLQYGFSLIPPICILVGRGLDNIIPNEFSFSERMRKALRFKAIGKRIVPLTHIALALTYILAIFWFSPTFSNGARWYFVDSTLGNESSTILIQNQMNLGNYVRNLTRLGDKMWTTDASVAFFAERTIVEPDSVYWKFQGFFQDVWGYAWTRDDYRGPIPGYPDGLITLNDILIAWQNEKPKAILFFESSLVDQFIWDGIRNAHTKQEGLANYVFTNYHLVKIPEFPNVKVWIRSGT
jgi:4-amino-4-deoxy-L-arabinose transferase-like glycosyltransferase